MAQLNNTTINIENNNDHDELNDSQSLTSVGNSDRHEQTAKAAKRSAQKAIKEMIQREAQAVKIWRSVIFIFLAVTAVILSIVFYRSIDRYEIGDFETEFEINALRIIETFRASTERKLIAINVLATTMTSYAIDFNLTFPFVTLPDFAEHGSDLRVLADSPQLYWAPLIPDDTVRAEWEDYAYENRAHVDEAYERGVIYRAAEDALYQASTGRRALQDRSLQDTSSTTDELPFVITEDGSNYHTQIFVDDTAPLDLGNAPYFPLWQRSPVDISKQASLNYDFGRYPELEGMLNVLIQDELAVFGKTVVPETEEEVAAAENTIHISQYRYEVEEFSTNPLFAMAYPIFDGFEDDKKLVGSLIAHLYWLEFFIQVLPDDAVGYICVLKNSFDQTMVYRLDGSVVTYMGSEDIHESQYEGMVVSVNLNDLVQQEAGIQTRSFTSSDLNVDYGIYDLYIYPSASTEGKFRSKKPETLSGALAGIFAIIMVVFYFFDIFVKRRQQIIMERAAKSSAIVASLFPEKVHARLYEPEALKAESTRSIGSMNKFSLDESDQERGFNQDANADPIADFFPATTILFADLAGFTSWSSSRDPSEVFLFLERLYGAFDRIAEKRNVFKVETIGDCYLAATGLPDPQDDHAVLMIKFAWDCLSKSADIFAETGSTNLQLRVGIHSGSVTAGILRGQKSRFQIFGDTVNMAAKMESSGTPGKIHISETTADEVIRAGKSHWLSLREQKGDEGGKTYWVHVNGERSVTTYSRTAHSESTLPQLETTATMTEP